MKLNLRRIEDDTINPPVRVLYLTLLTLTVVLTLTVLVTRTLTGTVLKTTTRFIVCNLKSYTYKSVDTKTRTPQMFGFFSAHTHSY